MTDQARRYVLIEAPPVGRSWRGARILVGPRNHINEIVSERIARGEGRTAAFEGGEVHALTRAEQAEVARAWHSLDRRAA